jgi:hypothetical protein
LFDVELGRRRRGCCGEGGREGRHGGEGHDGRATSGGPKALRLLGSGASRAGAVGRAPAAGQSGAGRGRRATGGAGWVVEALEKRVTGVGEERMNDGKIR